MVELVVAARRMYPTWGPKKIHVWLRERDWPIPAASTIGNILRREGLVRKRRRRRLGQRDFATELSAQDQSNAVWSADFKGWSSMPEGVGKERMDESPYCDPQTNTRTRIAVAAILARNRGLWPDSPSA